MMKHSLAVFLILSFVSVPLAAEPAEEVIEKVVAARGGATALAGVDAVRVAGHMFVQGMNIPYTLEWKRPNKVRFAYETHRGVETVNAFDGEKGWKRVANSETTEALSSGELSSLLSRCDDLDNFPLRLPGARGAVRLVGRVTIEGRDAYKLAIERSESDVIHEYVGVSDHLVFRRERTSRINGAEVEVVTTVGNYRGVGGILFAHSLQSKLFAAGASGERSLMGEQVFTVDSIVLDPTLDESRFAMPAH